MLRDRLIEFGDEYKILLNYLFQNFDELNKQVEEQKKTTNK